MLISRSATLGRRGGVTFAQRSPRVFDFSDGIGVWVVTLGVGGADRGVAIEAFQDVSGEVFVPQILLGVSL